MTQTMARPLDPELLALAGSVNAVGDGKKVERFPRVSHVEASARVQALAGSWGFVAVYRSLTTARTLMSEIRHGAHRAYLPLGSWEAEALPVGLGTGLFVRYAGGGSDAR